MSDKIRNCDARCHNATKEKCVCWCGGAFHGQSGAVNRQKAEEVITERFGIKFLKHYKPNQTQGELFNENG